MKVYQKYVDKMLCEIIYVNIKILYIQISRKKVLYDILKIKNIVILGCFMDK